MTVDVTNANPSETLADHADPEKDLVSLEGLPEYDPAEDRLGEWLSLFLSRDFGIKQPELSVYARILSRMKLTAVPDARACPMMAVTILQGKHILMYNPVWAAKASFSEIVATLAHEATHILLSDIPRFLRRMALFPANERQAIHRLQNVAMDAANNALLVERLRHMKYGSTGYWVLPTKLGLPDKLDVETYFEALLMQRDEILSQLEKALAEAGSGQGAPQEHTSDDGEDTGGGQLGSGQGKPQPNNAPKNMGPGYNPIVEAMQHLAQANAHDWANAALDEMGPEELEALAANVEAAGTALQVKALQDHKKSIGSLPAHMQAHLDALLEEAVVPWGTILRRMVQARLLSRRVSTMTRPHKRKYVLFYEDEQGVLQRFDAPAPSYPGARRDRTYTILFALDTSGSMSNEEVVEGLSEIQGILKEFPDARCLVVQCDVRVSAVDVLGPDMDVKEYVRSVGRTSGGGTTFEEPFKLACHINRGVDLPLYLEPTRNAWAGLRRVDLMVYHTDTYGVPPGQDLNPGCPVIWTVPSLGKVNFSPIFGQIIQR